METKISLDDLQGDYEIIYQSSPQLEDWYEPGTGYAKVEGNKLKGADILNVEWNADLTFTNDNKIHFEAILDARNAQPNAGLIDENGHMTRESQKYNGELSVIKSAQTLILKTRVKQGPLTIDVQFIKKS